MTTSGPQKIVDVAGAADALRGARTLTDEEMRLAIVQGIKRAFETKDIDTLYALILVLDGDLGLALKHLVDMAFSDDSGASATAGAPDDFDSLLHPAATATPAPEPTSAPAADPAAPVDPLKRRFGGRRDPRTPRS